jgi:hypothetical protein
MNYNPEVSVVNVAELPTHTFIVQIKELYAPQLMKMVTIYSNRQDNFGHFIKGDLFL